MRHAGFQVGYIRQVSGLAQERQLRLGACQLGLVLVALDRIQHRLRFSQFTTLGQAAAIQDQRFGVAVVFSQDVFEQGFGIGKAAFGKQRLGLHQRVFNRGFGHDHVRREHGANGRLRLGFLETVDNFAVFEQHHGGQGLDADTAHNVLLNVAVDLGQQQFALIILGDLFQDRQHHFARCAPLGPEIHQYGLVERRLDHQFVEVSGGYVEAERGRRLIHYVSRSR